MITGLSVKQLPWLPVDPEVYIDLKLAGFEMIALLGGIEHEGVRRSQLPS